MIVRFISVLAFACMFASRVAYAQKGPTDAGVSCESTLRELAVCRRATDDAQHEADSAEHDATACKRELQASATRLQQSVDSANGCQKERDRICSATADLVEGMTRGRSRGASDTGCVPPEQQSRLDAVTSGWSNASTWMSQLAAYESGESDLFPRARSGASTIERAIQRIAIDANGRTFHRRLLVEALKLVAPFAWERIRGGGSASIDGWFSATTPLAPDLVSEAQRAQVTTAGPGGPPLTAALHLVRAFELAAHCGTPSPDPRECGRARQLQQMLESTGSLVLRRRIQEIWATDCSAISSGAIMPWLEEFPSARLGGANDPWSEIAESANAKLFACYLDDATAHVSYGTWLKDTLPPPTTLTTVRLQRVDMIRNQWDEGSREAACARAVRAMQNFVLPSTCAVPAGDFREALVAWSSAGAKREDANMALGMCAQYAQLLWEGKAASIDGAFAHPPSVDEMVAAKEAPPTPMWRLRAHCDARRGPSTHFATNVATLASFARGFGEGVDHAPFRVDPESSKPIELVHFEASQGARTWLTHVARGTSACTMLGLADERCKVCADVGATALYDCSLVQRLEESWARRATWLLVGVAMAIVAVVGATWLRRLVNARRAFGPWAREATAFFDSINLTCSPDRLRLALPARHDTLLVTLPNDPAWQRWGASAAVVRTPPGRRVLERDVNHAAFVARRLGISVVLLEHDDDASADISAVRAMLEWAGKGGARAVQVLPIGVTRLRWSKSAHDVLDLVEESSLRGNPFEVRGRIATSTQFFNRERLVSGLLASAQAGHWTVITGLRRFGKSSLALEVARRLPGPSAYVDLAGFDHEISHTVDPRSAADRILRFVCVRLVESARTWWPDATMPDSIGDEVEPDVAALTLWFRELSRACEQASGGRPPLLVIIDEVEQALSGGPEVLARALEVLAIVVGRLKSAVGDTAMPDGGSPIGVFLTSALHPLLWAPLRTLAHQSIMGSFQRVCVPCLDDDAASTMMRSLGARQGIRFTDQALARIVAESQGVPILLRRLGASILELYDAERARQGSLGAVEIGVEGSAEAASREVREGSPLRVWIESEIAASGTVAGVLLRRLARAESVPSTALWLLAKQQITEDFVRTGIADALLPNELHRRAEEAAHVVVQLLDESGLVVPLGDLTAPEGYSLPDGVIRRVLLGQASMRVKSAAPSEEDLT